MGLETQSLVGEENCHEQVSVVGDLWARSQFLPD